MNRSVIIILLLAVLGIGGWYYMKGGEGVMDGAKDAASDAAGAAADAVEGAGEAAGNAVDAATDAAGNAADAVTGAASDAAGAMDAASLLDPQNFDPAKVSALLESADIAPDQKSMLKDLVAKAAENPEMVATVIQQIKAALGM